MSGKRSLKHNFGANAVGWAIYSAGNLLMSILLAKLSLGEESAKLNVGLYALGPTYAMPVMGFFMLNIRAVHTTDVKHKHLFSDYLGMRLIGMLCALLVYLVIGPLFGMQTNAGLAILITGIGLLFDMLSDVLYGVHQLRENMMPVAYSMAAKGILSPLLLAVGFAATHNVLFGIAGSSLASALVAICYDVPKAAQAQAETGRKLVLKPRWNPADLREIWLLSWPMGVASLLTSTQLYATRMVTYRYLGDKELGILATLMVLPLVGNTAVTALGQVVSPKLATYRAGAHQSDFFNLFLKLCGVGLGIGVLGLILGFLVGEPLLVLIFRKFTAGHKPEMMLVMLAGAFDYLRVCQGVSLTSARRFSIQTPFTAVSAIVSLALAFALVPRLGLSGSALAMALGSFFSLAVFATGNWLVVLRPKLEAAI